MPSVLLFCWCFPRFSFRGSIGIFTKVSFGNFPTHCPGADPKCPWGISLRFFITFGISRGLPFEFFLDILQRLSKFSPEASFGFSCKYSFGIFHWSFFRVLWKLLARFNPASLAWLCFSGFSFRISPGIFTRVPLKNFPADYPGIAAICPRGFFSQVFTKHFNQSFFYIFQDFFPDFFRSCPKGFQVFSQTFIRDLLRRFFHDFFHSSVEVPTGLSNSSS